MFLIAAHTRHITMEALHMEACRRARQLQKKALSNSTLSPEATQKVRYPSTYMNDPR